MPSKNQTSPGKRLKEIALLSPRPPAVLVLCPDRIRRERIVEYLIGSGKEGMDSSSISRIDAASLNQVSTAQLKENLASMSLFASERFFVLQNIEKISAKTTDLLLELLTEIPPDVMLLLCGTKLPASSRIVKFFVKKDLILKLEVPKSAELRRWAAKELRRAGIEQFEGGVVEALIESAEARSVVSGEAVPDEISGMVERLYLYVDQSEPVAEDVRNLFPDTPAPGEFEVIDLLGRGKIARVEELFSSLIRSGKSPFAFLALLSRTYTNYLRIAFLRKNGHSDAGIRSSLNMNSWSFNKHTAGLGNRSVAQLEEKLRAILRTDSLLKNRSLNHDNLFSGLFRELAK